MELVGASLALSLARPGDVDDDDNVGLHIVQYPPRLRICLISTDLYILSFSIFDEKRFYKTCGHKCLLFKSSKEVDGRLLHSEKKSRHFSMYELMRARACLNIHICVNV